MKELCACSKKLLDPEYCNLVYRGRPVCNMECLKKAEERMLHRREDLARMQEFTHE